MPKRFLSTSELAKIIGISRVAVFKRIRKGEIKAYKVGPTFVISWDELPPKVRLGKYKIRWLK